MLYVRYDVIYDTGTIRFDTIHMIKRNTKFSNRVFCVSTMRYGASSRDLWKWEGRDILLVWLSTMGSFEFLRYQNI